MSMLFQSQRVEAASARTLASTAVSLGLCAGIVVMVALSAAAVKSEAVQARVEVVFRAQPTAALPPPPPASPRPKHARSLSPATPTVVPETKPTQDAEQASDTSPAPEATTSGVVGGVAGGVVGGSLGGALREPVNLPENATPPQASADNAQPQFPEAARTQGLEGQVILKIVVNADGSVGKIEVMRGEEPFVSAALFAVKTWRYAPARVDGMPTAVFRIVKVPFRLRG